MDETGKRWYQPVEPARQKLGVQRAAWRCADHWSLELSLFSFSLHRWLVLLRPEMQWC
jgi:hypothetical protein